MDIALLRQVLLVMHLTGLALMVGITVSEFMVFRAFLRNHTAGIEVSSSLSKLNSSLTVVFAASGLLLVLSGTGLMFITKGVLIHQLWLKIKLSVILLLPLNGMLLGGPQMKKLTASHLEKTAEASLIIKSAVFKLQLYYMLQLLIFLTIIVLAVFRFS